MTALQNKFVVAIFDEFLDAFAVIPRAQQKKVNKFVRKFREDPTNPSINYESINTFDDPNLRTVRIDEAYRAIVLKPEEGNVYVLLWVDHHDAAMAWAKHKRISIHPETGALQVLTSQAVEVGPAPALAEAAHPIFAGLRDRELTRVGVPESMIPTVRQIVNAKQLDQLRGALPDEAYEALFFLSEGDSLEDVERAMAVKVEPDVSVTDFQAALDRDASKRRFVLVDNDEALEAMLDAPLEKWRVFLHPSQRKLVYRGWNGPVRVLGGAGTGKTVVAMHRAKYLAEKVFDRPDERILFTTYTVNLAADIAHSLKKLCTPEVAARIEVVSLDKWVSNLLRRAGYEYEIAYWDGGTGKLRKLWEEAMTLAPAGMFPPSFYRDEWELVVQPEGCQTWDQYKNAGRAGRGARLSRTQRKEVWAVFDEYRNRLEKHSLREPEDALRDAAALLEKGTIRAAYASVIVDEAQDMSTNAFRLLRQVVPEPRPNDLFIVGDGHQRIYRRKVSLSKAGVEIIGRGRRLRINYRTTDEIRRYAVALLEGIEVDDLDAGIDSTKGYKSLMHGTPPEVKVGASFEAEVDLIAGWLREGDVDRACVVARTNDLRDRYEQALQARGLVTCELHRSAPDDPAKPGVRVATMHRVKGLEFDRVAVAGMNEDLMPWKVAVSRSEDAAVRREAEEMERALLYVAITRAKRGALITAHGKPSPWIK